MSAVAVVTGASAGVGRAVADEFARVERAMKPRGNYGRDLRCRDSLALAHAPEELNVSKPSTIELARISFIDPPCGSELIERAVVYLPQIIPNAGAARHEHKCQRLRLAAPSRLGH